MMNSNNAIYAGFWRRLFAVIIDTLVLWLPASAFRWIIDESQWNTWTFIVTDWIQLLAIWTVYYGLLESPSEGLACVIELTKGSGTRLRISLPSADSVDWCRIKEAFLGA